MYRGWSLFKVGFHSDPFATIMFGEEYTLRISFQENSKKFVFILDDGKNANQYKTLKSALEKIEHNP
jgi:hypothetical protein